MSGVIKRSQDSSIDHLLANAPSFIYFRIRLIDVPGTHLSKGIAMRMRLETITNVATLLTCVAIVAFVVQSRVRSGPTFPVPYEKGEQIGHVSGVELRAAERTLFLALRKDCQYCEESIPFYKTLLAELKRATPSSIQLVAITTDALAPTTEFLSANGLETFKVISLSPDEIRTLKIPGTPTLILTDQRGIVEGMWVGKLDEDREREVLRRLRTS